MSRSRQNRASHPPGEGRGLGDRCLAAPTTLESRRVRCAPTSQRSTAASPTASSSSQGRWATRPGRPRGPHWRERRRTRHAARPFPTSSSGGCWRARPRSTCATPRTRSTSSSATIEPTSPRVRSFIGGSGLSLERRGSPGCGFQGSELAHRRLLSRLVHDQTEMESLDFPALMRVLGGLDRGGRLRAVQDRPRGRPRRAGVLRQRVRDRRRC